MGNVMYVIFHVSNRHDDERQMFQIDALICKVKYVINTLLAYFRHSVGSKVMNPTHPLVSKAMQACFNQLLGQIKTFFDPAFFLVLKLSSFVFSFQTHAVFSLTALGKCKGKRDSVTFTSHPSSPLMEQKERPVSPVNSSLSVPSVRPVIQCH